MSNSSNHSEKPGSLRVAELNPLLNPLLSENMGRWAEAYFRNPPESREQAIVDLLQQLESEKAEAQARDVPTPARENASAVEDSRAYRREAEAVRLPLTKNVAATIRCRSCGHESAAAQKFCGNCGAILAQPPLAPAPPAPSPVPTFVSDRFITFPDAASATAAESSSPQDTFPYHELLRYEEQPRSYRVYLTMAVLIVAVVCGYVVWKNRTLQRTSPITAVSEQMAQQSAADGTPAPSSSAPAQTQPQTQPSDATATPTTTTADNNSAPPEKNDEPVKSEKSSVENDQVKSAKNDQPLKSAAMVAKEPSSLDVSNSSSNGSQELAVAQAYLNGTGGHEHNANQAVDWLWKSVGKRNSSATILLADLYMRGNEVPKNCDQARILLDAAAGRGIHQAAVRLRNMQAFGCQ